jgi:predicted CXXCH cytochrome family protein
MSMSKSALLGFLLILAAGISFFGSLVINEPAQAREHQQETTEYCQSCHANPDLSITLQNGERLSLYVSPSDLDQSVHAQLGFECQACHTGIQSFPHPEIDYSSRRELSEAYYLACQKCHSVNFAKAQDSIHAQVARQGNPNAPICIDCHGAHDVQAPNVPRSRISETCSQCHTGIFDQYRQSIHGTALLESQNPDVPVCTDCHGVHNIQDPRTAQFRVQTPELCAGCHANEQLMSKYGLSADVYSIYTTSWHGVELSVYKAYWPTIWHEGAVCTDCHGVHNILPARDPASSVNPANLLATCQKCHPSASANWTGAWTGHHPVSLQRTPFVYYTQTFYESFIPIVLWLSGIYVVLQILHALVDRALRSLK